MSTDLETFQEIKRGVGGVLEHDKSRMSHSTQRMYH